MVKIYFINCSVFKDGKAQRYIELEKGAHELIIIPVDTYSLGVSRTVTVSGSGAISCSDSRGEGSTRFIYIKEIDSYIAYEGFPLLFSMPEVVSQRVVGGFLITEWRGGRRYLTAEKGDFYCNLTLNDSGVCEASLTEGGVLTVSSENRIAIIDSECNILADVTGSYDIGDRIQTVAEYRGVIGRTILENYSLKGDLIGRKIIRRSEDYPAELKAHAFIEAFIVGDMEFAHNMMSEELADNLVDAAEFIGKPARIVTDELPLAEGCVIAAYGDGSARVFRPTFTGSLVTDVDADE